MNLSANINVTNCSGKHPSNILREAHFKYFDHLVSKPEMTVW